MFYHKSVLLKETLQFLDVKKNNWYLDATLGDGGHALAILQTGGNVVGIDVDPEALQRAKNRLEEEKIDREKYILIQGNFRDLKSLVNSDLIRVNRKFSGIIFDLGVSSLQFDEVKRGFSFSKEAVLDMRMDPSLTVRAADLVNGLNKGELIELFTKLGEERFAQKIAEKIVNKRPINTTVQLASLVEETVGRHGRIYPATKIFQALRIAVNDELNALREALPQAIDMLLPEGKLVIVSFHSLEDRIVKDFLHAKEIIVPTRDEIRQNPRSRSARMRVFVKHED